MAKNTEASDRQAEALALKAAGDTLLEIVRLLEAMPVENRHNVLASLVAYFGEKS